MIFDLNGAAGDSGPPWLSGASSLRDDRRRLHLGSASDTLRTSGAWQRQRQAKAQTQGPPRRLPSARTSLLLLRLDHQSH